VGKEADHLSRWPGKGAGDGSSGPESWVLPQLCHPPVCCSKTDQFLNRHRESSIPHSPPGHSGANPLTTQVLFGRHVSLPCQANPQAFPSKRRHGAHRATQDLRVYQQGAHLLHKLADWQLCLMGDSEIGHGCQEAWSHLPSSKMKKRACQPSGQ
jgi:hypothetical protein